MAKPDLDVKITVEQTVHGVIADALNYIAAEFGIRINEIRADWVDTSTMDEKKMSVSTLEMKTTTNQF